MDNLDSEFTCKYCTGDFILDEIDEITFKELPIIYYDNYKLLKFLPKTAAKYLQEINNSYLLSLNLKHSNDLNFTEDSPKWKNDGKFDLYWGKQQQKIQEYLNNF